MPLICPTETRLREFLDGSLGDEDSSQISQHVGECPNCDGFLCRLESEQGDVLTTLREGICTENLLKEPEFEQLRNTIRFGASEAATVPGDEEDLQTGTRLRDYRLVKKIGEGGMGTVYQAVHVHLAKHVALKILPADKLTSAQSVKRFRQEMRAVGKVNHPNVVSASDAGTIDGHHFLVMELVQGADLARIMHDRGLLSVSDACEIVRQAAIGLQHAHDNGLVHRDVKPSNIMLAIDGNVKLLDLGLAGLNHTDFEPTANVVVTERLTSVGQIMGTLDYMAPEQITASPLVDGRADIYALGATLFQLLTGRTPCGDRSEGTPIRIDAILNKPPLDISTLRNDIPEDLRALLLKMLAKNPVDRPQAASEIAEELKRFASHSDLLAIAQWCRTSLDMPSADVNVTDDVSFVVSRATQPQPQPQPQQQPKFKLPRRGPLIALASFAFVFVLLAAAVYRIQTNHGIVLVEVNDPTLKVEFSEQTITVNEGNKKPLTIRAGEQSLVVREGDSDFEFETDGFEIRRGDKIVFKVELQGDEVVVSKDGEPFAREKMPADLARNTEASEQTTTDTVTVDALSNTKSLRLEDDATVESLLQALNEGQLGYPLDDKYPKDKQPLTWGGPVNLQLALRGEPGQETLYSPVLDLFRLGSKSDDLAKRNDAFKLEERLSELSIVNGRLRLETAIAAAELAFCRGDFATAKERSETLQALRSGSLDLDKSSYVGLWLVARYALAFEETAAIGRELADLSLEYAAALPDPRFKEAILRERGKLLQEDQRELAKAVAKSGDLKKAKEILRTIPGVGSAKPRFLNEQLPRFDSDAAVAFKLAEVQQENGDVQAATDSYLEAFRLSEGRLIDYPFIDFFQGIGRGADLADIYTEAMLKQSGVCNYIPRQLYGVLVADEATRGKAYELLKRDWKSRGDDERFDYLEAEPESFRDNPEKLFYLRLLLLPKDIDAEGVGWELFNRFQFKDSLRVIDPLLQDKKVVQQMADEIRDGTEKYPQWIAGVAILSVLEAELGNFDQSANLVEQVLATKEQLMPANSARILGRSIEGKDKQLDQLVIRLYEYNLANDTFENGNYSSPALNLAKLYQQADQKSESRRSVLALANTLNQSCRYFRESDGMRCTLCHYQEKSITDYNLMTEHLADIGYPVDSLLLQNRIDESFQYILTSSDEQSVKLIPELELRYYADAKQKFLTIRSKAEQGVTPQSILQALEEGKFLNKKREFDLSGRLLRENEQSAYFSPVLQMLKLAAASKESGSAEAIAAIDERLMSMSKANPRDVKTLVAATVFAFERNDLDAAEERLKKLLDWNEIIVNEIPSSSNLSVWFAARLALQHESTNIVGNVLAERVMTYLGDHEFFAVYRDAITRERAEIRTK